MKFEKEKKRAAHIITDILEKQNVIFLFFELISSQLGPYGFLLVERERERIKKEREKKRERGKKQIEIK